MKSKLKLYSGKKNDEVEEILSLGQTLGDANIDESNEKGTDKLDRNTISLVFVDESIVNEASSKIVAESKDQSDSFVGSLSFGDFKFQDVESAFSSIDQTIEEQFQKAREKARKEAGLDEETKQQQRMRIESEFRERRRRRIEEQRKKADGLTHIEAPQEPELEIEELEITSEQSTPITAVLEEQMSPEIEVKINSPVINEEVKIKAVSEELYSELFKLENEGHNIGQPIGEFTSSYLDKKLDVTFEKIKKLGLTISKSVSILSDISARGIEKVDALILNLENRAERRGTSLKRTIFSVEHYFEKHKKQVAFLASVSIIGMLIITFAVGNFTAYEYMYNGKVLGIVKNQEEVYKTVDVIGDKLIYEHNAEIKIDKEKDITFNRILAVGQNIDDKEDILNRLTYMKDVTAKGYAIIINGKQTTILANEEDARNLLDDVQNQFRTENEDNNAEVAVRFEDDVHIEGVETKLGSIESEEKAAAKLLAATTHKAEGSDKALLNIQTEEVLTYNEAIPYTIAYEDTMTKYRGETTVKSKGIEGQKQIIAKVVKTNGKEVERQILEEATLSEPIAQIVLRGAKEPPKLVGTGTFIYPIRGTITSRFGYRWGDFHQALDIAAPTGTPIKASDGGTVTYAGWKNSYGYIVEIDHGGNRTTKYAHCSKLMVKAGQKVYQGMHIANVGNTGNSTGPHVHFEVLINGVPKNPLGYL